MYLLVAWTLAEKAFINLSSKDLSLNFIIHDLETSKRLFLRAQSFQIVRSADLIKKIGEMYKNNKIYPIALTFHQDDLPLLRQLDVFSFIRRVQTVVFEGDERMVIDAKYESRGLTQWHDGNYDSDVWAWKQPASLMEVLRSHIVTAVKHVKFDHLTVDLVIELSWFVTEGDLSWTVTKTF